VSRQARHPDDFANAFTAAFLRLQAVLDSACRTEPIGAQAPDWPRQVAAAIRAGLEWAAANPDAAGVLTNEALAQGPEGVAHHRRLIDDLAFRLSAGRELRPENLGLPTITERALAGGLCSFVARRLDTGRASELPALAPEAIQFVLTPYLGAARAKRAATGRPL
jgi:hypothetical protein